MSREHAGRRVVVASDQALLADVLCAALGAQGIDVLGWGPDLDLEGVQVGLVLADPANPVSRAYVESVVPGGVSRWVMVTDSPPSQAWMDALGPTDIEVLDSSTPLTELAVALHERSHDAGRDRSGAR